MYFFSLTEKWRGYSANLIQNFDCFETVGWLQSDIKTFLQHPQIQYEYAKCYLTSQKHNAHWIRFVKLLQKNIKSMWDTIRNVWIFFAPGLGKNIEFSQNYLTSKALRKFSIDLRRMFRVFKRSAKIRALQRTNSHVHAIRRTKNF